MAMSLLRKTLKKMLPKMSQSEAIALEAGGLGFEKEIFTGKPNFDKLLKDLPAPKLTKEEKAFIDGPAEELCKMLDQWAINNSEEADLPEHVWDFIKKNKFLGMEIPKKDGGLGFSHYAHSAVVEKLASRSVTAAVSVMVPNSLGPGELIHRYGTKKQQEYFLPRLAEGK
ncbi:MAG: acyl-CoA dehydrogenase, partial [Rickettsiales bacterium]|nr:acyl-CoA dehydrogenase [Rickettsiales bacterium]